jgi:hypothetical protein
MTTDRASRLQRSVDACIANGRKLLEDAEWSTHQASTGLALAMLAQEECAKAFVLALVRDEILPWTEDCPGVASLGQTSECEECSLLIPAFAEFNVPKRPIATNRARNTEPPTNDSLATVDEIDCLRNFISSLGRFCHIRGSQSIAYIVNRLGYSFRLLLLHRVS